MKESRRITPLRTILRNCLNHIENLETNPSNCDNYDKEFQDLKQFSETLKIQKEFACTEGEKEVNRKKNRYKDILPFNVSRVVLSEYAGVPGSDYINANFIKGASGSPAYIASQGPLPNTVNDFWRMVVECEVQVIVMACNAQESGKHKCENYWVEKEGEEKRFGMVQICLVKASIVCPDFLVRTMRLKYTNDKDVTEERTVCQFHYSAWPDHGVPPLVRPLLDMVRLVRDTQASETLPVLVHCSAGCGRTGTICAIDFVWGLLRAGKLTEEFSLFNLVRDMRKQRVAMVQTKEQYILVHQAVRELFKEQLQVIESHPYENIDFNGVPLIKDLEEPFYDTICVQKEDNCDEKQDKSELKEKGEDGELKANKGDIAPPLPRKKRPNVLFSKQEKEAENLTEKNRLSYAEKEKDRADASFSSILGKPRIVKLRALFEKSPNTKERSGLKDRGSQTVSRSHSLGAMRKPITTEFFESQLGKSTMSSLHQAPSDPVKLKHSKSFSKSVPLIKRSKSLKSFSQTPVISLSPSTFSDRKAVKSYSSKSQCSENTTLNVAASNKPFSPSVLTSAPFMPSTVPGRCDIGLEFTSDCSIRRRRSLESLMGDLPPTITWPITVMEIDRNAQKLSPKINRLPGQVCDVSESIRQQLQCLNLESEKKIISIASGLGTRERRNSFRQAVSKSDFHKIVGNSRESPSSNVEKIKNSNEIFHQPDKVSGNKISGPEIKKASPSGRDVCDYKKHDPTLPIKENSVGAIKNVNGKPPIRENSTLSDKNTTHHVTTDPRMRMGRVLNAKCSSSRSYDELNRNLKPKNLFLRKLNSEILSDVDKLKFEGQRPRSNCDTKGKTSNQFNSGQTSSWDLNKYQQKIKVRPSSSQNSEDVDETDGLKMRLVRPPKIENIDKLLPQWSGSSYMKHPKGTKPVEDFKTYSATNPAQLIPTPNTALYKGDGARKDLVSHHSVLGETSVGRNEIHKNSFSIPSKKNQCYFAPSKVRVQGLEVEMSPSSSDRKIPNQAQSDFSSVVHSNHDNIGKKFQLPSKSLVSETNHKSFDCLPWHSQQSASSRSSGEGTSSDQLSTKSDCARVLTNYELDASSISEVKPHAKSDQSKGIVKMRSTESPKLHKNIGRGHLSLNAHRRPDDVLNSATEFSDYGAVENKKQPGHPLRYSKDDFVLDEPTAPPRVKRHASVTIPRSNLSNAEHVSNWATSEKKSFYDRNKIQCDSTCWNDSLGVDLDAVAASIQQGESSVLKSTIWPGKNSAGGSGTSNFKKKQHYF